MEAAVLGEAAADFYMIGQDAIYRGQQDPTRMRAVGAELRWPWVKAQANGVTQVIEPVVQMVLGLAYGQLDPERGFGAGRV